MFGVDVLIRGVGADEEGSPNKKPRSPKVMKKVKKEADDDDAVA